MGELIPFFNLQEKSHFLIRPLRPEVDPKAMNETAHRHTYQEILWVWEGNGQHTIDGQLYTIEQNTFYFIYQGQVHYFNKGEHLKGFLIRFNNEFLNEISPLNPFTPPLVNKITLRNDDDIAWFKNLANYIFLEFSNESMHKGSIVRHLFMGFLYKLSEKMQAIQFQLNQKSSFEDQIYNQFGNLLEKDFSMPIEISRFAKQLAISTRHLCTLVKNHSGKTTKQLIVERRMLEAKRLLAHTSTTLKEIAWHTGFHDVGYFCRMFKIQTGFTPSEFKEKMRVEQQLQ